MAQKKSSEMSDQEIKDIMKAIARANGRPLTDERIDAAVRSVIETLGARLGARLRG